MELSTDDRLAGPFTFVEPLVCGDSRAVALPDHLEQAAAVLGRLPGRDPAQPPLGLSHHAGGDRRSHHRPHQMEARQREDGHYQWKGRGAAEHAHDVVHTPWADSAQRPVA